LKTRAPRTLHLKRGICPSWRYYFPGHNYEDLNEQARIIIGTGTLISPKARKFCRSRKNYVPHHNIFVTNEQYDIDHFGTRFLLLSCCVWVLCWWVWGHWCAKHSAD